jgi:hypothetical protein
MRQGPGAAGDDDVEGHRMKGQAPGAADDDDDVEGHRRKGIPGG